jgi:hypothetical protein
LKSHYTTKEVHEKLKFHYTTKEVHEKWKSHYTPPRRYTRSWSLITPLRRYTRSRSLTFYWTCSGYVVFIIFTDSKLCVYMSRQPLVFSILNITLYICVGGGGVFVLF